MSSDGAKHGAKHELAGTCKSIVQVCTYLSVGVAVTNERRVVGRIQRSDYCNREHHIESQMIRTRAVSNTETYLEICPLASDVAPCHISS